MVRDHKETLYKESTSKEDSKERVKAITLATINDRYNNHLHIFTDGSKQDNSTTAAIWVPQANHQDKWKLDPGDILSIMSAEMYAIIKAAEWLALNAVIIENKQVVILTDSMSALETMKHWPNTNHQTLVNQMIGITNIIEDVVFSLTLQFVPSHVGTEGNEMADQLAWTDTDLP